jgi:restriction system protein
MTIPLPKYDDFLLPTLRVLEKLGGSATTDEINDALIGEFGLSDQQLNARYPKSGALMIPDRMSWARSYLKYPGFVTNLKRGVWVLTEEGREAATWNDNQVRTAVSQAAYADTLSRKTQSEIDFEVPTTAPGRVEEQAWSDVLLAKLQAMDPSAFERLSQRLLRESGFVRVEVTGKSGDGGIDGHGVLRMNLISFQVLFQCKRYKGSVAAGAVRDFRGAMQGRADKGLIITTGTFTPDARREATRDGAPAIDLIDGEALTDLLKSLKLGVRVEQVVTERMTVDESFFDEI